MRPPTLLFLLFIVAAVVAGCPRPATHDAGSLLDDGGQALDSGGAVTDAGRDAGAEYDAGAIDSGIPSTCVDVTDAGPIEIAAPWSTLASSGTCATKVTGSLYCWGLQGPTADPEWVCPPDVTECAPSTSRRVATRECSRGKDWTGVTAMRHICGRKGEDLHSCWGSPPLGGHAVDGGNPHAPPGAPLDRSFTMLALTWAQACGIEPTGELWCWGKNDFGQVGDGTTIERVGPVVVGSDVPGWGQVAIGGYRTCALSSEKRLYCWGALDESGAGADLVLVPTEHQAMANDWTRIALNVGTGTCGVKDDGTLWCWGANASGELGDGTTTSRAVPTQEATQRTNWSKVVMGNQHTCATTDEGELYCWGTGPQLGLGAETHVALVPTQEASHATDWTDVAAGPFHTCALKTGGAISCWGHNEYGELGTGDGVRYDVPTPIAPVQ